MSRATALLRSLGPLVGLAFAWGLFALLAGGPFTSWSNQRLMLLQSAVVGTAAVGATLVIVSGGIDLSVGSAIALGTVVVAKLLVLGASPGWAAAGGVVAGGLVGLGIGAMVVGEVATVAALAAGLALGLGTASNLGPVSAACLGVFVAAAGVILGRRFVPRLALSPFIVTLGLWGALRGIAKGIGDNQPVYPSSIGWLEALMRPGTEGMAAIVAPAVWILLVLAVVLTLVLRTTRFGRHVFAVGSNEETARLCGVNVARTRLWVYVVAAACAGVAAVLQLSFLSMGDPTTADGYELRVIAAVVIGGASLAGGEGSIGGTLIGVAIMMVVDNGCTKLGLDNWVQEVVTGAIIVAAVALDRLRQERR